MAIRYTFRAGNSADFAAANPILAAGEPSQELDTGVVKLGDGATAYNNLLVAFIIGRSSVGVQIDDSQAVDTTSTGNTSTTLSSQAVVNLLRQYLAAAQAYTDNAISSASLNYVVVAQASDGTWPARPGAYAVLAIGYPGRNDPPSWLVFQVDSYRALS